MNTESHCAVLRLFAYLQTLLQVSIACQENPLSVIIQILDVDHTYIVEVETPHDLYLQISERTVGLQAESDLFLPKVCFNLEGKPPSQVPLTAFWQGK